MKTLLALSLLMFSLAAYTGEPCAQVDRTLTEGSKKDLAPALAKQLGVPNVDVLQLYRYKGWTIIYVDTHETDETFLFFSGDPHSQHYITSWSGAAAYFEEKEILQWLFKAAPGIPAALAKCFAWHVTKNRDI
jgi:hypothetical protein